MDSAEDDVLAYMTFHPDHWTKISSTNPLERRIGEVKRRTDVVGRVGGRRKPRQKPLSKKRSMPQARQVRSRHLACVRHTGGQRPSRPRKRLAVSPYS
jgi:hypothetical protein